MLNFFEIEREEDRKVELNSYERRFFDCLMDALAEKGVDVGKIRIEERSNNYKTICYGNTGNIDFLRFKLTERTKWISLSVSQQDRKTNKENPFFSSQKNKGQRHWKASMKKTDDFLPYIDLIINSINEI